MKRLFIKIACIVAASSLLTSCDLFKLDNFDGPNAQISGSLIDAKTGKTIQIEAYTVTGGSWWAPTTSAESGALVVIEDVSDRWEGYYEEQDWMVKFNGTYANNRIFAGKYAVDFKKLPVYSPADPITLDLKEGSNSYDFQLTPFCRVTDPQMSFTDGKITATFSIELGNPDDNVKIQEVVLCANTTNHVGANFNVCNKDAGARATNVNPGEKITLTIDPQNPNNAEEFRYERDHYLRIGVLVKSTNNPGFNANNLYNFSETYVMNRDKQISLYDWSTAN